jgi:hypothetical protein
MQAHRMHDLTLIFSAILRFLPRLRRNVAAIIL